MKRFMSISALTLLSACAASRSVDRTVIEPTPPPVQMPAQIRRSPPVFTRLGDSGAQQATLHTEPLPALGARLEIRIIGVGQDQQLVLPTTDELALEVRTGNVLVTIDGRREQHVAGDIFLIDRGARVTIAPTGEASTLRAIVLVKE